ncbi:MAG: Hsp33 family molecular chaperone HslO [Burkholderiaceae bacterium]
MANRLLRFLMADAGIRGEWVELDTSWFEVVKRHSLDDRCTSLLGELIAATLLLAATIKHEGSVTAQIVGDGPVKLAVVQSRAEGSYRATLKLSESRPLPDDPEAALSDLLNPGGQGRFVITIDPETEGGTSYQGIVPLEGQTVARMLERYMFRSEQLPTRMWLAANGERVSGLLLQKMPLDDRGPSPDSDGWNRMQKLGETLTRDEMLEIDGETALHRLFWQEPIGEITSKPLHFACQCSRDRVATMLKMLGQQEIDDIIQEQGNVSVNCEYCNTPYVFDPIDSASLFSEGAVKGSDTRQ